jgi:hypothetical protein
MPLVSYKADYARYQVRGFERDSRFASLYALADCQDQHREEVLPNLLRPTRATAATPY